MKILLLGPNRPELIEFLSSFGDEVIVTDRPVDSSPKLEQEVDFILSYGYRYILKKNLLSKFEGKAINLHISLLPWNKGADPNLWSFLENSPKGVTIHYIDTGIDTGDIIAQREIKFALNETLRSSYNKLSKTIEDLFKETWPIIRTGKAKGKKQSEGGSYHKLSDIRKYEHLLKLGWDTPIINLIGKAEVK